MSLKDVERVHRLKQAADRIKRFHQHLKDTNQWLHKGQIELARLVFHHGYIDVMEQCGRNFGKSHVLRYCAIRYALQNERTAVYIGAPQRQHAYEIHWTNPESNLLTMIPAEFLCDGDDATNKSELRVNLKNGSYIKLFGVENISALRGIKPHFLGCDEFQDWSEDAWVGMAPNLIAKKATVIKIGTPPDKTNFYIKHRAYIMGRINEGSKRHHYREIPTSTNPLIDPIWLDEIRKELYAKGQEAVWKREYLAQFVPGGAGAVFPNWDRKFIKPHDELMAFVKNDSHKLRWFTIADPGSTSTFAVLFACYNQFTSRLYLLGEIYERDPKQTRTIQIYDRIKQIEETLAPSAKWTRIYDQAAKWFANEVQYHYRINLSPTNKQQDSKERNISLIKDIMFHEHMYVSERCKNFVEEIEGYVLKDNGDLPDEDDHLMDCLNYLVSACNFRFYNARPDDPEISGYSKWRKSTQDWTEGVGYYDA